MFMLMLEVGSTGLKKQRFMQHWTYWEHKMYAHICAQLFHTLGNYDILARCRAGKHKKMITSVSVL